MRGTVVVQQLVDYERQLGAAGYHGERVDYDCRQVGPCTGEKGRHELGGDGRDLHRQPYGEMCDSVPLSNSVDK